MYDSYFVTDPTWSFPPLCLIFYGEICYRLASWLFSAYPPLLNRCLSHCFSDKLSRWESYEIDSAKLVSQVASLELFCQPNYKCNLYSWTCELKFYNHMAEQTFLPQLHTNCLTRITQAIPWNATIIVLFLLTLFDLITEANSFKTWNKVSTWSSLLG